MNNRMLVVSWCLLCAWAASHAQQPPPNLKRFLEKRLSDRADAAPPTYEALLAVIDTIAKSSRADLESALPLLSLAIKSKTANVPIEAVFAYFEISRRADGGTLLRHGLPEVASLMASPDDRLSGASVTIMRNLTRTIPEATVPLLISELEGNGPPSLVKSSVLWTLLESPKRGDPTVLKLIEAYLAKDSDVKVRSANLQAIATTRVETPVIVGYVASALGAEDKYVQMAAIRAVYALSSVVQDQTRQTIAKMAGDTSLDPQVRSLAEKALQNKLGESDKLPEPPTPPTLRGMG